MEQTPREERIKSKWLIPAVSVLCALLLVGGGLFLALHGGQEDPTPTKSMTEDEAAQFRVQLLDSAVTDITLTDIIEVDEALKVVGQKRLTGGGVIRYADAVLTQDALLTLQDGASLTLDGVTVDANHGGNGIYVPANSALTIQSGSVQFANGWNIYNDGSFTMIDGLVTGAGDSNIITTADAKLSGGTVSKAGSINIQLQRGMLTASGGNIVEAGGSGVFVAHGAALQMDGELIRVRDNGSYGVEVEGKFRLDYANIIHNSGDNVHISDSGTMEMNDGYISTGMASGIKNRGELAIHGGIIEYNGVDGVATGKTCIVDGGSINSNVRRGFSNETGGTLTIEGSQVTLNGNKFGLYNEVGAMAELRDVTISASGTNSVRNFGKLYMHDCVSSNSSSVHISTLPDSYVYLENVVLDTNTKSHGIYNYAGTVEFKKLTVISPNARAVRNIGGTVKGSQLAVKGTYTTGVTNENVENRIGLLEINGFTASGTFDYGIYNFGGTTQLSNVSVGVTNKNSLRVENGNITVTNATFAGCNQIPGSPDTAVYDAYFTGGVVTLNNVTLKNSYSSLIRNRSAEVTLNDCTLIGSGAAAINNTERNDGAWGNVTCNNVKITDGKTANVRNECPGTITLNGCYLGVTANTNVACYSGTIILEDTILDGTNAEGEKVGFVVYEDGTGILRGNSIVRNTYGKGVSNLGTFYMYSGTITNCTSRNGAGLNNEGTAYVYGGTISDNHAIEGNGGAVRANGPVYISNALIENNTAVATGGAISIGAYTYIKDTVIRNNHTVGEKINGGAIYVSKNTLELDSGTVIEGNITNQHGGGIAIAAGATTIIRDGVKLTNNVAKVGSGGAVINYGTLVMYNGEIIGNTAGKHGGGVAGATAGVFQMHGGTIENNTANENGGGVYQGGGSFEMAGGTVVNNTAVSLGGSVAVGAGSQIALTGGSISGGKAETVPGIYVASNCKALLGPAATVEDTLYLVSSPITLLGVYEKELNVQYSGYTIGLCVLKNADGVAEDYIPDTIPAIRLSEEGWTITDQGILSSNEPWESVAQIGDTIYPSLESAFMAAQPGDTIILLEDCQIGLTVEIDIPVTLLGNGHTVTHGPYGGNMITIRSGGSLTLGKADGSDVLILDGGNQSDQSGARHIGVAAGGSLTLNPGVTLQNAYCTSGAGSVHVNGGQMIMNGGVITGNTATKNGGAILVENKGVVEIHGGSITGNTAQGNSGAIHIATNATVTINGATITGNNGKVGGAIAVASSASNKDCTLILNDAVITGNHGTTGNDIYVASAHAKLRMSGNVTVEDFYLNDAASVAVTGALANTASVCFNIKTYSKGHALLTGSADVLADCVGKVTLSNTGWLLCADGTLTEAPSIEMAARIQGGESYTSLSAAFEAAESGAIIELLMDADVSGTIEIKVPVTLLGNGHTVTHGAFANEMFSIVSNGSLTLGKADGSDTLILDGGNQSAQSAARHITVKSGGSLTLNPGVTLQNAYCTSGAGSIHVPGGQLIMNGGVITGNTSTKNGGAILIESKGTMVMHGGTISGNTAQGNSGAIHIATNASVTINGGTITGNTGKLGGAIAVASSASNKDCTLILNDAAITGNHGTTGNDIYVASEHAKLRMSGNVTVGDFYLNGAASVAVTGALANTASVCFNIKTYSEGHALLTGSANVLADCVGRVTLANTKWKLNEDGTITAV